MATDGEQVLQEQMRCVRAPVAPHRNDILERWQPRLPCTELADSAEHLARYPACRQLDLRPVQAELTALGMPSLRHIEASAARSGRGDRHAGADVPQQRGDATLDGVLRRMQSHRSKRTSQLRSLRDWERLYWTGTRTAHGR